MIFNPSEPRTGSAREAFLDALVFDDPVQLYERAPCGFLSTTPDGLIVKCNSTFRSWVGYDAAELVGSMSLIDLLTPGGRIYHETHYAPSLRMQGQVREIALDLVRKDGGRLPVLLNATMAADPEGHVRVVRIAVFDATERRRYERELLRAKEVAEDHERHARELSQALQRSLIPPRPPAIPDLEVATAYHPAGTVVGGDFYDVFPMAAGDWAVVIGDVRGKGVDAALVTAFVRHTVRDLCVLHDRPAAVLRDLDLALSAHETERFCTLALLRLRRVAEGWRVVHTTGGHPPPMLRRRGGAWESWGAEGYLVGADVGEPLFGEVETVLGPGDALVLYTDGTIEARRPGAFYGEEGLLSSLSSAWAGAQDVNALVDRVVGDALAFQDGVPRDDIATIALAVPADREAPAGGASPLRMVGPRSGPLNEKRPTPDLSDVGL
ncbi:SpoIIE family protein phosphatase [Nocardioides coralli]|uniref:SpoIIE family protein phosphatase n=1 Tax=Nocardioides coralli TaxID=2872154 RepID=UPI001CA3BE38|nr:SpoIIE family protein phosphatase [Nocardioides coralli]QZY28350.1 SpoIIE family protein phosphatase [Nocardioides coralli]